MNKLWFALGLIVVAVVRAFWKKPGQQKPDSKEQVRDWENEGGQVVGVRPPRVGR
jgi:hypothetical protein